MSFPTELDPEALPEDAFEPALIEPCDGSQLSVAEAPCPADPRRGELVCSKPDGEEDEDFDDEDFDDDFDDDFEDELDEELNDDLDEFDEDIEEGSMEPGGDDDEDGAFEEDEEL